MEDIKTQTEQAQNHDLVQTLRICDTTNYTHSESHSHFPGATRGVPCYYFTFNIKFCPIILYWQNVIHIRRQILPLLPQDSWSLSSSLVY